MIVQQAHRFGKNGDEVFNRNIGFLINFCIFIEDFGFVSAVFAKPKTVTCHIMKIALTTILTFFSLQIFSQVCACEKKSYLKDIISCDITSLKNGAKIYWNYDCNSSWITFQNKNFKKKIFFLEEDLQDYSGRLGFIEWTETKNHFLVKNKVISGCCEPLEIVLFNKDNGNKIKKLGTLIFDKDIGQNSYFLILQDLNTVLLFKSSDDKTYTFSLPKGRLEKTLKRSGDFNAENYFTDAEFKANIFTVNYKYLDEYKRWKTAKIKMKL